MYALSAIIDTSTTKKGLSASDEAFKYGIPRAIESNRHLNHVITANDYRDAWKRRIKMDGIGLAVSILLPEAGAAFAAAKLMAGLNNHRLARRHQRATEIARNS